MKFNVTAHIIVFLYSFICSCPYLFANNDVATIATPVDTGQMQEIARLRNTLEDFFRNDLMPFNNNALYQPMDKRLAYLEKHQEHILRKAEALDQNMAAFMQGKYTPIAEICRIVFEISRSREGVFKKLQQLRSVVHVVNVGILNDPRLNFYLYVDAPRVRQQRLIILPCTIENRDSIQISATESLEVFFLSPITNDKLHRRLDELPFHAKYVPGKNHLCINMKSMRNGAERIINGIQVTQNLIAADMEDANTKPSTLFKKVIQITKSVLTVLAGSYFEKTYIEVDGDIEPAIQTLIARSFIYNIHSVYSHHDQKEIEDYLLFNTKLYLYGKYRLYNFSDVGENVTAANRYAIERVIDEIAGSIISLAFGKKLLATEMRRHLMNIRMNDPTQRLSLASRYMLIQIAKRMPDYVPEFSEHTELCKNVQKSSSKEIYGTLVMHMVNAGLYESMLCEIGHRMLEEGIDNDQLYEFIGLFWNDITKEEFNAVINGANKLPVEKITLELVDLLRHRHTLGQRPDYIMEDHNLASA
ncbi:MAG: hypothetical protein JW938_01905 [Candidatus Omnitrophica bacterium]|nr:hypothetical protein [Candidatus Omnitrophota bacterium]